MSLDQKKLSVSQVIGIIIQILIFMILVVAIFIGFGIGLQPKESSLLDKSFTWTIFQMIFGYKSNLHEYGITPGLVASFSLIMVGVVAWITCVVLSLIKKGSFIVRVSISGLMAACLITAGVLTLCSKTLFYSTHKEWLSTFYDWETFKTSMKLGYASIINGSFAITSGVAFAAYNTIVNLKEVNK